MPFLPPSQQRQSTEGSLHARMRVQITLDSMWFDWREKNLVSDNIGAAATWL